MTNKTITYDSSIFNVAQSFNLYGYENIDFNESKKNILSEFKKEYEEKLKTELAKIGLKYCGLNYFSPHAYNYEGDSVDLKIRVVDKELLKEHIKNNSNDINKMLFQNQSYNGYIATTRDSVKEELEHLNKPDYEPDILVLNVLLNKAIDFKTFFVCDYIIYEGEIQ